MINSVSNATVPPDSIRAEHLIEALPYLLKYQGATIVIKFGGHAMTTPELKNNFAKDITLLRLLGLRPIVVHGGGPQINSTLAALKIESYFVEGLRYTDSATMEVVEMVLCGTIGKDLVSRVTLAGGSAIGLSGKDSALILAEKIEVPHLDENGAQTLIDIGFVGNPIDINTKLLEYLTQEEGGGLIPIISPVGTDSSGQTYNINADTAAGAIASALKAHKLILLTDVPGVLNENQDLIITLTKKEILSLKQKNLITGGMIPKLDCCLTAMEKGCNAASIIDGRVPHALLLEIFTHKGCGTEIKL
ncbi:MAG: acetylglutamate kinase [Deltaproteobacteria bacterium]|jgi:acetylglutamate kinase|nr:acetylglutamate kinase [Deltaproteobacteria bacterium]